MSLHSGLQEDMRICYHYSQIGHVKTDLPLLKASGGGGAPKAPTVSLLRITDGCVGVVGTKRARGRAFQLTAEEAQATPKVEAGIFFYLSSFIYFF